jgi:hypothetical protein
MDSIEKTFKMVTVNKPVDFDIKTHVKLYQNVLGENESEEEREPQSENTADQNEQKYVRNFIKIYL